MRTKTRRDQSLSPEIEAVLARLCEKLGPLTTTKAVKLPYLVDVVASEVLGRRITDGTFQTWEYGVVTREVWTFVHHGDPAESPFEVKPHHYSEGGYVIRLAGDPAEALDAEELAVVDAVAERYGRLDAESLGILTKRMNTQYDARAWGQNHEAAVDEDAYARLSTGWQSFCDRLPALDLTDESQWGDPIEDPYEYLRRELLVG